MNTIELTARAVIHQGKLEEFRRLAAECMRMVREKESGTLQYAWFLNEAETECVVLESYKDSQAVLAHIANLGSTLGALLTVGDWTFEFFGSPSPELIAATTAIAPKVYAPLQSL
jgi:quinol monooxygenase YgiN